MADAKARLKEIIDAYGDTGFGRSALMARRLVQTGVPFVEIGFGGWDLHQNTHDTLSTKLPEVDSVVSRRNTWPTH